MRKVYIRYKEDLPESTMCFAALNGFRERGVQTVPFYGFGDIDDIKDLSQDVGLVGFVGDVHQALKHMGFDKPESIDYPDCLKDWMHRSVRKGTLQELFDHPGEKAFVKPVEEKLFTGFVWPNYCSHNVFGLTPDAEVYITDVVEFKSEYRVCVLDGEIVDCRRYKGDWSLALNKDKTLEAVEAMSGWAQCPRAYCLDLGVTDTSDCCLVEVNDAYSFGNYGLMDSLYAKILEARWENMVIKAMRKYKKT